jgi:FkbM family methyltransferase
MNGATGNIYAGLHEFPDMAFTLHFLQRGDLFVDIGSNIGSYTILAAGICQAEVVAFEPDPATVRDLQRNVALNHLESKVKVHQAALGSQVGSVAFSVGLDTVNHVVEAPGTSVRMVDLDTLDHAADGRNPVLIKMDVEGYEYEVLCGAANSFSHPGLKAVLIECRSSDIAEFMKERGFAEYGYDAFSRKITAPAAAPTLNALWIRDLSFVRKRIESAARIRVLGVEI